MKRTLAMILVLAMLVCMLPAFSLGITAEEPEKDISGLNATLYQLKGLDTAFNWNKGLLDDIIPNAWSNESCSYDDAQHFDASIDQMLKMSKVVDTFEGNQYSGTKHTGFDLLNRDGYFLKFSGTITAKTTGTYYLVGRVIDNGFVAFVDQDGDGVINRETEKFYEYWTNHWFDDANHRLPTDKGGFYLEADKPTTVEFWYLEMEGGDVLNINVSTNSDGSNDVSFADAGLTMDLTRTCYISNNVINHDRINNVVAQGVKGGEPCTDASHWNAEGTVHESGNCSSASDPNNHKFDATFEAVKAEMMDLGTITLANFERSSLDGLSKYGWRYEDSMIVFDGYMTPAVSGAYQFGTASVDNCLVIDINTNTTGEGDPVWTRAYEFWAGKVWNDRSKTYSADTVELEKDVSYQIRVVYLEIDGGEGLSTLVKINGEEQALPTAVAFTTEKPTAPVKPSVVNLFDGSQSWYYKTSGTNNDFQIRDNAWMTDKAVYGTWGTTDGNFGVWKGTSDNPRDNQSFWAVTEVEVADVSEYEGYELMAQIAYDDNIRVYVNGKLVTLELRWGSGLYSLGEEAAELLKTGTNTIAIKLVQGWGGFSVSVNSVYLTLDDNTNNPYEFKYVDKNGVKQDGRIKTVEQFMAYVADANARGDAAKDDRISIEADLDFSEVNWVPFTKYVGKLFGNGHTFSNITYTAVADATTATEGKQVGLFATSLANCNGGNGLIYDLNFDNCTLTVDATQGNTKETSVMAGIVAGLVDRGRIENVTVNNSEINGNAAYAAGIAGVASYNFDENNLYVENCGVSNTVINATVKASGILSFNKGDGNVVIGRSQINNVTLDAPASAATRGDSWGWSNERYRDYGATLSGTNRFGQTLTPDGDYDFYFQTRTNTDGTVDVRVICVTTEDWLAAAESVEVTITLTDGTTPKSKVVTPETFYKSITATADGVTDVYTGGEGTVIFGWVITDVPAAYATETNPPAAVFN